MQLAPAAPVVTQKVNVHIVDVEPMDAYDGVVDTAAVVKAKIDGVLATQLGATAPKVEVQANGMWLESFPPQSGAEVSVTGQSAAVDAAIRAIAQIQFDI